ncbi:MAG: HNH endonuclease [Brachybacterium sp.]
MFLAVQSFDPASGDPHRMLVDSVRAGGPQALAALLGDGTFALREIALRPQQMFAADATLASAFRDVVGTIHELRSAMDALEARAVTALAESLTLEKQSEARAHSAHEESEVPPTRKLLREAASEAAREVSMLIGKSPASAAHSLASQRRLVSDMPEILTALATAQVTSTVAHATARSFAPLSPEQRLEADRELGGRLPDLDGAGGETWDDATSAAIAGADPGGQGRRHQHARQERHITVRRAQHGMATVSARVSALDAAKIRKRFSLEAERLRAAGDRRGHQAIQADAFVDTLIGREEGMEPTTLDIGIIITDRALLHPGDGDLARIEGYGVVPAEAVRDELGGVFAAALADGAEEAMGPDGPALRAVMRRLYAHPLTGELVAVESRARAFPEALARFIRWRDQVCRGPFCDAPIRQTDHIRPHAAGGETCLDNGQGLCAYCNGKEQQTRTVRRVGRSAADGHVVEWISRTGTRRTTRPRALTPEAPRRPAPPPPQGRTPESSPGVTPERRLAQRRRRARHTRPRRRRPRSRRAPDTPA